METAVKRVCLVQLVFPLSHFGLCSLIGYMAIYHFGHYEPKDGPDGSFKIELYIFAFATTAASLLYSTTFLINTISKWNKIKTISPLQLSLPIAVSALFHVGIYFPLSQIGYVVTFLLWLIIFPIILAAATLKFIISDQSITTET